MGVYMVIFTLFLCGSFGGGKGVFVPLAVCAKEVTLMDSYPNTKQSPFFQKPSPPHQTLSLQELPS